MKKMLPYFAMAFILNVLALSGCSVSFTIPDSIDNPTLLPTPVSAVILPTESITYNPIVVISPTSGQAGTMVQVVANGFLPNTSVSVAMGPVNSGFSEVARGTTDSKGVFKVQIPAQGGSGKDLIFAVAAEGQPGILSADHFHIVDTSQPVVSIVPANGESGTPVQVVASGFPPNTSISVGMGPINSELSQVMQGNTDTSGVFIANVLAQGEIGMRLVFAVIVNDQPEIFASGQFQIVGAIPNPPLPVETSSLPPTPTPYLDMWTTYTNPAFAVSLEYPADWQPVPGYGSSEFGEIRFGGVNGFFHVGAMDTETIDMAVSAEAEHILKPYGGQPTIEALQIQGQEARLILPSEDQPIGMQHQAAVIIRYPQPVSVLGTPCHFFILWVDQPHIRVIAQTVRFMAPPQPVTYDATMADNGKTFIMKVGDKLRINLDYEHIWSMAMISDPAVLVGAQDGYLVMANK